ncbi:MAG: thrombospondin type 3 repeat-containing protein [Myxococcota bacterium]
MALILGLLVGCTPKAGEVGAVSEGGASDSATSGEGTSETSPDDSSVGSSTSGDDESTTEPPPESETGAAPVDCSMGGYGCCNDADADGLPIDVDLHPDVADGRQLDADEDGFPDKTDLCNYIVDETGTNTADSDRDGIGNACDLCGRTTAFYNENADAAAVPDYMQIRNIPLAGDYDGDGVGDACDNCPTVPNCYGFGEGQPFTGEAVEIDGVDCQADADGDMVGDACDPDVVGEGSFGFLDDDDFDGDGLPNIFDACPRQPLADELRITCDGPESCPEGRACTPSGQCNHMDSDVDGVGDVCDTCAFVPNPSQAMAGGGQDDDPDGDFVGEVCEIGADQGCGDRSNAARIEYHPVAVEGACCTVELLQRDNGDLVRIDGCPTNIADPELCDRIMAPHPESPGQFLPVRMPGLCTEDEAAAFECVALPTQLAVQPGIVELPDGCAEALDDANLTMRANEDPGEEIDDTPWLRACRRPQLDSDFDGLADVCDFCPWAWDPSNENYVDANGMFWPQDGAVCNGVYAECVE